MSIKYFYYTKEYKITVRKNALRICTHDLAKNERKTKKKIETILWFQLHLKEEHILLGVAST